MNIGLSLKAAQTPVQLGNRSAVVMSKNQFALFAKCVSVGHSAGPSTCSKSNYNS